MLSIVFYYPTNTRCISSLIPLAGVHVVRVREEVLSRLLWRVRPQVHYVQRGQELRRRFQVQESFVSCLTYAE